jgi:hypothetical protein
MKEEKAEDMISQVLSSPSAVAVGDAASGQANDESNVDALLKTICPEQGMNWP